MFELQRHFKYILVVISHMLFIERQTWHYKYLVLGCGAQKSFGYQVAHHVYLLTSYIGQSFKSYLHSCHNLQLFISIKVTLMISHKKICTTSSVNYGHQW